MARILVIEDDKIISRSIQIVLTSAGYTVASALSGEDGLVELAKNRPDVLITDVSLPGIDGIEVLKQARTAFADLKVIVISGAESSIEKANQAGASAVLEKPFSSQDFLDAVDSLLGTKR